MGNEQVRSAPVHFFNPPILIYHRNASLGQGDTNDRTYPEQVILRHHDEVGDASSGDPVAFKLQPVLVRDVQMSRLHTGRSTSSLLIGSSFSEPLAP
jgi:hypothetical protein